MIPRAARNQRPPVRRMYVAFALGGRRWVLPADAVDSVAEPTAITPLPTADPRRVGVFLHRDRAVAAVSPGGDFDLRRPAHCVVLREEGYGLLVDELLGLQVKLDDELPEGFELFDRASLRRPSTTAPVARAVGASR